MHRFASGNPGISPSKWAAIHVPQPVLAWGDPHALASSMPGRDIPSWPAAGNIYRLSGSKNIGAAATWPDEAIRLLSAPAPARPCPRSSRLALAACRPAQRRERVTSLSAHKSKKPAISSTAGL